MTSCETCDYNDEPSYTVSHCLPNCPVKPTVVQEQKRIWKQVSVSSSSYLNSLTALTAAQQFLQSNTNVNWNQMSDRVNPHKQTAVHPTHGNSLRSTLTSGRPGAGAPGGVGVDVKHDSYARFLNKRKARALQGPVNIISCTAFCNQ